MRMDKEQEQEYRNKILSSNKILYCMKDYSCMDTCMCWGLECNQGWLNAINEMSNELEALNYLFYPKFRVRIQMDQVKEKFGLLTCYYSIVCDPPMWMCKWNSFFHRVFNKIAKTDFKCVSVLDKPAWTEVVEDELKTREEFEQAKKSYSHCGNVEVFERDGKFIKKSSYEHYAQTHSVPTRYKLLYKLLQNRHRIENFPEMLFNFEPSHQQQCIEKLLDNKAQQVIKKAEDECYNVCERCGTHISDDSTYAPRCTTRGYIQYLCKSCAADGIGEYVMNGAVYSKGELVMSKEDYEKKKANIAAQYKALEEGDDSDEDED